MKTQVITLLSFSTLLILSFYPQISLSSLEKTTTTQYNSVTYNSTSTGRTLSSLESTPLKSDNHKLVYNISKQLCWGCIGESLEFLVDHNLVRAKKFELPLIWDTELERYARWWAGQRSGDCKLQHSFPEGGFELGENIFWGSGSQWTPNDAVKAWASEEKYYDYESNSCVGGQMCGHYTQIVWSTTRRVGCARVVCQDGDVFMTCNYYPPGNYVGERPY